MRLIAFGIAFLVGLGFLLGSAAAQEKLAEFSVEKVYITIGKGMLLKVYLKNPDSVFANISIWLEGDYPKDLAKFAQEPNAYFTPDMRNATVGMNPKEERVMSIVVQSTEPKDSGYSLMLNSNTTAGAATYADQVKVYVDYAPNFPGLDFWGFALLLGISGLAFWRFQEKK